MFSTAFFGSLVGTLLTLLVLLGGFLIWDYFDRRKQRGSVIPSTSSHFDNIPERELESHIVQQFSSLFPNLRIYNDASEGDNLTGIQLNTKKAGIIDILALDGEDNFVIFELKKAKAPDRVVAQVDRYIEWVERHLAQSSQSVRAIVIAQRFDSRLLYTLARREKISAMSFSWEIGLNLSEASLPDKAADLAT